MKIAFTKVRQSGLPFEIKTETYDFLGTLSFEKRNLVKLDSILHLKFDTDCDRCGNQVLVEQKEPFVCLVSDGSFEGFEESYDVLETFDGFIDLDEIAKSEISLLKSDYNYCTTCQNKGD